VKNLNYCAIGARSLVVSLSVSLLVVFVMGQCAQAAWLNITPTDVVNNWTSDMKTPIENHETDTALPATFDIRPGYPNEVFIRRKGVKLGPHLTSKDFEYFVKFRIDDPGDDVFGILYNVQDTTEGFEDYAYFAWDAFDYGWIRGLGDSGAGEFFNVATTLPQSRFGGGPVHGPRVVERSGGVNTILDALPVAFGYDRSTEYSLQVRRKGDLVSIDLNQGATDLYDYSYSDPGAPGYGRIGVFSDSQPGIRILEMMAVPEPGTFVLASMGVIGLAVFARRPRRRRA